MEILNDQLNCQIKAQEDINKRLNNIEMIKNTDLFYICLRYVETQINTGKDLYNYLSKFNKYKQNQLLAQLYHLLSTNEILFKKFVPKTEISIKEKIK